MNAKKLKMKIIENGMTQVAVAEALGLSYQSLYTRIVGRTAWELEETKKLKKILNMTAYEYMDIFEIE